MGRCLRPCQQVVGTAEYRGEVERVVQFLQTGGRSLIETTTAARERLSGEMDFEGAAMMHERLRRVEEIVGLRDEMARDVDRLHAITITPSAAPEAVELGFVRGGYWQGMTRLEFGLGEGTAVSLDARLCAASMEAAECKVGPVERMEQLAILSRWFYSSWRDGEMLLIDDWSKIPYRKLVNAVSRVANPQRTPRPGNRS
jgi:excinuclease ABC subunit C